jgi:spermidine synthase
VRKGLLYVLLFLSGAAGLVYEVCWSRELSLVLGTGERGQALTLCAFFAGLGAGYALAAALSMRLTRSFRAYAVCEALVCLCALVLPWLSGHFSAHAASILWGLAFVASVAMGASLPLLFTQLPDTGRAAASAYAFHLLGATGGSLLASFVLISHFGVWGTSRLAAGVSALCALLALVSKARAAVAPREHERPSLWGYSLAAFVVGAVTLALEVLTLRLFALTLHNSTYTFGLTLSVFIVCLAAGSRRAAKELAQGRERLFSSLFAAAFGVLTMMPLFAQVTGFGVLRAPTFASYIMLALGLVLTVLVLPVVFLGKVLPLLWASSHGKAGRTVGALTAANSAGGVLGALLASFVLLPMLGLKGAFLSVALTLVLLALALAQRSLPRFLACFVLLPCGWLTWHTQPKFRPDEQPLFHWNTAQGWLDIVRTHHPESLSARLDLHYQLGASRDRERHAEMGSLPLRLHPDPQRVLFIGLATGMTASPVVEDARVHDARIVELIPEMDELARHFAAYNAHLLDDPRVHVVHEDGRAYLARAGSFDVAVSDLFVPWHSHAGYLYTLEHYRHVRARLAKPSGLFVQWLPLWQLGEEELALIADTFAAVFAGACVWIDDRDPDRALLALVSDDRTLEANSEHAVRRLGRWHRDAARPLNTDEHPRLEFSAPRTERSQALLVGERLRAFVRRAYPQRGAQP